MLALKVRVVRQLRRSCWRAACVDAAVMEGWGLPLTVLHLHVSTLQ